MTRNRTLTDILITEIHCNLSTTKISPSQTFQPGTYKALPMFVCTKHTALRWVPQQSYSIWLTPRAV